MITIPLERLYSALSVYKIPQKVLSSARLDYPRIEGNFDLGPTYYMNEPLVHATDIEIQLCLNQLAYVGIAEMILQEIKPFNGLKFNELQKEHMVILESRKRFRRQIPTNRTITGEIAVKGIKQKANTLFVFTDFQFENKSVVGNLELAILNH